MTQQINNTELTITEAVNEVVPAINRDNRDELIAEDHDLDAYEIEDIITYDEAYMALQHYCATREHFNNVHPAYLLNNTEAIQHLMPGNVSQLKLTDDQECQRQALAVLLCSEFKRMRDVLDTNGVGTILDAYESMIFKVMFDAQLMHQQLEAAMSVIRQHGLLDDTVVPTPPAE